jgi:hypothetical protein
LFYVKTTTLLRTTAFHNISFNYLSTCFLIGAIICTTGDFVHVITKTDAYPADGPFPFLPFIPVKMPVWVPFLFGFAVVMLGIIQRMFSPAFKPRLADSPIVAIAAPFIFLVIYMLTGFIQAGTGGIQDVWLAAVVILFWLIADGTLTGLLLCLVAAVIGTSFEIFLVHIHGFYYLPEHANFFGVPSWLPWLYMAASASASLFTRFF